MFRAPSAHHQENQLYQYIIWYISLCVGDCLVCRSGGTGIPDSHLHRVIYTRWCIDTIDSPDDENWVLETCHQHLVFCLTTGPKPPPKRFLHTERSRASSFKWEYPFLYLRSSSSFLPLLPRLLVTSISPFSFPSITCFRRQFLLKVWPNQLGFRFLISCRIFVCSLTVSNTSSFLTRSVQLIFSSNM